MARFKVGDAVMFPADYECSPNFTVPKGTFGIVAEVAKPGDVWPHSVHVLVEGTIPGLTDSEWENVVDFCPDNWSDDPANEAPPFVPCRLTGADLE